MNKSVTITAYRLKGRDRGKYKLVVWIGDEEGIHGKAEIYIVKGKQAALAKRDKLAEFWDKPEHRVQAGNGLRSNMAS